MAADLGAWTSTAVTAARMYYERGLTQEQIGDELGLTRWKINRLLAQAREAGIVHIEIVPPDGEEQDLAAAVRDHYGLLDCVITPPMDDDAGQLAEVGRAASRYLAELPTPPSTLAVSWGRTMSAVAEHIPEGWANGVHVVLANGALSRSYAPTGAAGIAESIAAAAGGTAEILPGPAISEQANTRELLESDRAIAQVLEPARQARVAIFGLGALGRDSVLVRSGYLTEAELDELQRRGAVGDVLGRFVDAEGQIVDDDLDARVLGLTRDDLQAKEHAIGVAAGRSKRDVIAAALAGGWINVLVTDRHNAHFLLKYAGEDGPT